MATMRSFSFKSNEPDFPGGPECFLLVGWPEDTEEGVAAATGVTGLGIDAALVK